MQIAAVLNAHSQPNVLRDSLDSILVHVTENILVVVDGAVWQDFKDLPLPASKIQGFYHNARKSPYRNVALGLSTACDTWPEADWYLYCEYDVLFGSDRFKRNLKMAEERGVWMLGNDGHIDSTAMPLVQSLLTEDLRSSYYLLGCCQFFHKNFMVKLKEINFFERFLTMTSGFDGGFMPLYSGYDISEHMYPSLCRHFGGNIGVFATYDEKGSWHGSFRHYPMRWKPELDPETENYPEASIMHPVKSFEHPIRVTHRERRLQWKNSQRMEKQ
jgi:hypothetical protein